MANKIAVFISQSKYLILNCFFFIDKLYNKLTIFIGDSCFYFYRKKYQHDFFHSYFNATVTIRLTGI